MCSACICRWASCFLPKPISINGKTTKIYGIHTATAEPTTARIFPHGNKKSLFSSALMHPLYRAMLGFPSGSVASLNHEVLSCDRAPSLLSLSHSALRLANVAFLPATHMVLTSHLGALTTHVLLQSTYILCTMIDSHTLCSALSRTMAFQSFPALAYTAFQPLDAFASVLPCDALPRLLRCDRGPPVHPTGPITDTALAQPQLKMGTFREAAFKPTKSFSSSAWCRLACQHRAKQWGTMGDRSHRSPIFTTMHENTGEADLRASVWWVGREWS